MVTHKTIELTLEELSAEVASLLEEYSLLGGAQDNRVSPVPDMRTIRYYTSLGLLDRPKVDGRQAKYGKRHLLQVLSIKALQAVGLPLSEIQAKLYGRSDNELELLLGSLSQGRKQQPDRVAATQPIIWQEVIIEPGLKIMVEAGWQAQESHAQLAEKIAAVLAALYPQDGENGGN